MSEDHISEDQAREKLDELLESYDMDVDDFDEDQAKALRTSTKKIIRAMKQGRVEIKDDSNGKPVVYHHIVDSSGFNSPICYARVKGAAKTNMKNHKAEDFYGRLYSFMGGLCGVSPAKMLQMESRDLSILECLGQIFLQI